MSSEDEGPEFEAPGWEAIDDALRPIYGTQEPKHWGTVVSWAMGGPDPIQGISAYRSEHQRPHLHYVTYGISNLYDKNPEDDPDVSGFGFELTFRLAQEPDVDPPNWVLNFLQNLARYVFESGRTFGIGHTLPLNGPIERGSSTSICAITFALDPELGQIVTPNGRVKFLQIVGLTEDELEAIQYWNAARFAELLAERNPLLLTDTARDSWLRDDSFQSEVERYTQLEGASCPALYSENARFTADGHSCRLVFGAIVTPDLSRRLAGRIPYGRDFTVYADDAEIRFEPGAVFGFQLKENGITLQIPSDLLGRFRDLLRDKAAICQDVEFPGLTIEIEKTVITDNDGNVTEVVG